MYKKKKACTVLETAEKTPAKNVPLKISSWQLGSFSKQQI